MAATAEKRAYGTEDLEGEGSNSLGIEDLARSKNLKVEDKSAAEESQVFEGKGCNSPEVEDLARNKKQKVEHKSTAEESQVPEMEDMAQNKKSKIEEQSAVEEYKGDEFEDDDEEWVRRYYQQVEASEGFDVGPTPNYLCGAIGAVNEEDLKDPSLREKYFIPRAMKAIENHNMQKGEKLELVDIVKVNAQAACGIMFYYTLLAKDDSGETKIYQAQVESLGSSLEFPMFRLKV